MLHFVLMLNRLNALLYSGHTFSKKYIALEIFVVGWKVGCFCFYRSRNLIPDPEVVSDYKSLLPCKKGLWGNCDPFELHQFDGQTGFHIFWEFNLSLLCGKQ